MSRVTAGKLQQLRCWLPSCTRTTAAERPRTTGVATVCCDIRWRGAAAINRKRPSGAVAPAERCLIFLLVFLFLLSLATVATSPVAGSSRSVDGSVNGSISSSTASRTASTHSTDSSSNSAYISGTQLHRKLHKRQLRQQQPDELLLLQQQYHALLLQRQRRGLHQQRQPQAFDPQKDPLHGRQKQQAPVVASEAPGQASGPSTEEGFAFFEVSADAASAGKFAPAVASSAEGREAVTAAARSRAAATEERTKTAGVASALAKPRPTSPRSLSFLQESLETRAPPATNEEEAVQEEDALGWEGMEASAQAGRQQVPPPVHAESTAEVAGVAGAGSSAATNATAQIRTSAETALAAAQTRAGAAGERLDASGGKQKAFDSSAISHGPLVSLELESLSLSAAAPAVRQTHASSAYSAGAAVAAAHRLPPPQTVKALQKTVETPKTQRKIGVALLQRLWQRQVGLDRDAREMLHTHLLPLQKDHHTEDGESILYEKTLRDMLLFLSSAGRKTPQEGKESDELLPLLQKLAIQQKGMQRLSAELRLLSTAVKPQAVVEHVPGTERPTDLTGSTNMQTVWNVKPVLRQVGEDSRKAEEINFEDLLHVLQSLADTLFEREAAAAAAAAERKKGARPASTAAVKEGGRQEDHEGKSSEEGRRAAGNDRGSNRRGKNSASATKKAGAVKEEEEADVAGRPPLEGVVSEATVAARPETVTGEDQARAMLDAGVDPRAGLPGFLKSETSPLVAAEDTQDPGEFGNAYGSTKIEDAKRDEGGDKVPWNSAGAGVHLHENEATPADSRGSPAAAAEKEGERDGAAAAAYATGSSAAEEDRDRKTPKNVANVLRPRAGPPWVPEGAAAAGADFVSFIQLSSNSSSSNSKDQEDVRVLHQLQNQRQETRKEKGTRQQPIRPHGFTEAAAEAAPCPLREARSAFATGKELLSENAKGREDSEPTEAAESSLLLAVQKTFSATEEAAEAAAAEQRRLQREASFLGASAGRSVTKSSAAGTPEKRDSTRLKAAAQHTSLKGVSPRRASSSLQQQQKQPLAFLMPLSHLQEQVQQTTGDDEENWEEEGGSEAEQREEARGAGGEEEEKGGEEGAAAAKEGEVEKKEKEAAGGEEKKSVSAEKKEGEGGAEEEEEGSFKTSMETREESSTSGREEKEEEATTGRVEETEKAERKKETHVVVEEEEGGAAKEEKKEKEKEKEETKAEAKAKEEKEEEKGEEKKEAEGGGPPSCTDIEDAEKCTAEPRCFHDEVYHQCFFNCTLLLEPDECKAHVSCRYEEVLPRNACVNEGYQATSISSQSFEGILRGCEEFRTKESCDLMTAATARLRKKGVPVLYNCQWLESTPLVSAHPVSSLQLQERGEPATEEAKEEEEEEENTAEASEEGNHGSERRKEDEEKEKKREGEEQGGEIEENAAKLPPAVGGASLCVNMAEVPTSEGLVAGSILAQRQKDLRELEESRNVSADKICPFPEELATTAKLVPSRPFYAVGDTIEVECLPGHVLVGARHVITCEGKAVFSPRVDCIAEKKLSSKQLQYMTTIEKYANFTSDHPDIVTAAAAQAEAAAAKAAARSSATAFFPANTGITTVGLAILGCLLPSVGFH